jgi:hypothetical protein
LGPSSRSFAGSTPSAGRNSMPGTLMFCVSAFKNRQPRILARPPLRSRVAIGGRGHARTQTRWKLSALSCLISHNRCQPNLQQTRSMADCRDAQIGLTSRCRSKTASRRSW